MAYYLNGKKRRIAYYNGNPIFIKTAYLTESGETLTAPRISLDGDTLTMTATDERTETFAIFVGGVEVATVDLLFTFTINNTTYYAEEGMTWAEWVESKYNTGGFYVTTPSDTIINGEKDYNNRGELVYKEMRYNTHRVYFDMYIEEYGVYEFGVYNHSGGSN